MKYFILYFILLFLLNYAGRTQSINPVFGSKLDETFDVKEDKKGLF